MVTFGTAGIRGDVTMDLTPVMVARIGRALVDPGDDIVIGRDGRLTGESLAAAAIAGMTSGGADVEDVGVVPTPALAFASRGRRGVMVTASHNPPGDNGIKVFEDGAEIGKETERQIERRIADPPAPVVWNRWGQRRREDVLEAYRNAVLRYVEGVGTDRTSLSVLVDCGNGVGGLVTPWLLRELGVDHSTLNGRVDGHFPAHPSEPRPDTLRVAARMVADGGFDLGLAHDGDADRLVVIDEHGRIVHEDTILAIIAHHYVASAQCADPVVITTPNASTRVDERVTAAGGRVERTALGTLHERMGTIEADTAAADTEVVFAGEPWKHIHPAFGGWIDGVVGAGLMVQLVREAGGIARLREPISERPYHKENVRCPNREKEAVMQRLEDVLRDIYPEVDLETDYGIRLVWPSGDWLLVRPSGTEPKIRLYMESDDPATMLDEIRPVVEQQIATAR